MWASRPTGKYVSRDELCSPRVMLFDHGRPVSAPTPSKTERQCRGGHRPPEPPRRYAPPLHGGELLGR